MCPEGQTGEGIAAVESHAPAASRAGTVAVRADEVTKSFRRGIWPARRTVDVLRGVSFEIRSGELVGLVGENGSGKTTLMQIIVGLLNEDGGTVERSGSLGYCPQIPLVWGKLTVAEHFELFAQAYRLPGDLAAQRRRELLGELEFTRYAGYRVEDLSGGTRQKLNLALSLMHRPDLLLLDEPYAGFDWETYLRFWTMSERLRSEGMAILIVSHLISERDRLDRILELAGGRVSEA